MLFDVLSLRNTRRPSRLIKRRWEKRFAYGGLFLFSLFAFGALCVYVSHREEILVGDIFISGNALISAEALKGEVQNLLSGNYIGLFPKRNSFLVRKGKIATLLEDVFPAVESVVVRKPSLSSLDISVSERIPFALWCGLGSSSQVSFHKECFFIDKQGMLFIEAPNFSSSVYLEFESVSDSAIVSGDHFLPQERFGELIFFIQQLKQFNLMVEKVSIEKGAGGIDDYIITLSNGPILFISTHESLEQTLNNISTFFNDPGLSASQDVFLGEVEYLDFRFGNKVYYK